AIIPFFILLIYTSPTWTELDTPTIDVATSDKSSRYIEEFENIELAESTGRVEIWQDSLAMAREHPWLGIGSGHYKLSFPRFIEVYKPFIKLPYGNPLAGYLHTPFRTHNDYLQIWIELGIIALIALVTLFSVVSWQAWKGFLWMQQTDQIKRFFLLLGTFGGFVAWTVSMLFEFPFRMPSTLFIGWLFAAAVFILTHNKNDEKLFFRIPLSTTHAAVLIATSISIITIGGFLGQSIFFGALYHAQGELALKAGNINQALFAFSESYKKAPWEEDNLLHLARIHLVQKNYSQAKLLLDQIIRRQPYLFLARLYRAQASYALGNKQASREDIRFVVQHMPFLPEAEKYRKWLKNSSD
ncbi:MAG: O-antigen ligase family protein, partial [Arenicellales bacterium]